MYDHYLDFTGHVLLNTGRGIGTETYRLDIVFPPDDLWFGSDTEHKHIITFYSSILSANKMQLICLCTAPLFTKKVVSHRYRNLHYKPQTVWRPSQVYKGNPNTNKKVSS